MEEQFAETLQTEVKTRHYNIIIIIILTVIIIGLTVGIIILAIKLNDKSTENEELTKNNNDKSKEFDELKNNYSLQNDTLNIVYISLHNLISNADISNPQIEKTKYVDVKGIVSSSKGFQDGTYDFVTKNALSFNKGYQVAFETFSRNSGNYYSDQEYDNIVYKLSCLFGANACIGVYDNNPHISFYIEDKNTSLALAAIFNQKSIWDWGSNKEITNNLYQPKYY